MQPPLTVSSLSTESNRKTLLVLTILGVIAAWLGLAPAYANWSAFVDFLTGKSTINQPVEKISTTGPSANNTVPVISPPQPVVEKTKPAREPLPYVGGVWRSGSGHVFFFELTGTSSFDIYEETSDNGQIKIGSGSVSSEGVNATVRTLKEHRLAQIELQFANGGKTLKGTFSGLAKQEKNFPLTLSKEE